MPQVTAAPFPITFGSQTYSMSPLRDTDIDEINNWLRASYIKMARESIDASMSKVEREELLGVAMDRARRISFMEGNGSDLVSSLEGFIRIFWQGIKRNHPGIPFDAFKSSIFSLKDKTPDALAADVDANMKVFTELNAVATSQVKSEAKTDKPGEQSNPQ